jgi:hypothetical protein
LLRRELRELAVHVHPGGSVWENVPSVTPDEANDQLKHTVSLVPTMPLVVLCGRECGLWDRDERERRRSDYGKTGAQPAAKNGMSGTHGGAWRLWHGN